MKNFFAILGVLFLIVAIAAVGVLGYYSKGFHDWSFLQHESGSTTPGGDVDPGGSTTPGGDVDPGGSTTPGGDVDPQQCAHEYEWTEYEEEMAILDVSDMLTTYGLDEYEQGYLFSIIDPGVTEVGWDDTHFFAMLSKDEDPDTKKWYFTTWTVEMLEGKKGDVKILAYTDTGTENFVWRLDLDIKVLGISFSRTEAPPQYGPVGIFYNIKYSIQGDTCIKCGAKA